MDKRTDQAKRHRNYQTIKIEVGRIWARRFCER